MTKFVWLITDQSRTEFLTSSFTVEPRDEREITLTGEGFVHFTAGQAAGVRTTLLMTEYTTRRANSAHILIYNQAMEEHRLKKMLDAAGVLADGVLEKILSPEVKGMIEQAPALAAVVRARVVTELDSLLKSWKKG